VFICSHAKPRDIHQCSQGVVADCLTDCIERFVANSVPVTQHGDTEKSGNSRFDWEFLRGLNGRPSLSYRWCSHAADSFPAAGRASAFRGPAPRSVNMASSTRFEAPIFSQARQM
jgi:hypothetical protein